MLKLKRLHLEELEDRFQVLSKEEQETLFGAGKTYTFDRNGRLVGSPVDNGSENPDKIKVGNNTCNCPTDVHIDTFAGQWDTGEVDENNDPVMESYSGVSITGANPAMFRFLARNTVVEWGLSYNEKAENRENLPYGVMATNYNESEIKPDSNILKAGYDTLYHSHPNGSPASCDDIEVFNSIRNRYNQTINHYIYESMGIYNPITDSYDYL